MANLLRNKSFVLLSLLYFFFSICVSLVHPITTIYVNSLSLPSAYFGFFYASMSLGQVVGSFFWGFLSDKIGRKVPLVIGIVGYAGCQALFGYVNSIAPLIIAFRFLSGFFVSAPLVLFLSITLDEVKLEERTNALSLMAGMNILGGSLAYEIGGALYDYASFSIPFIFLTQIACCLVAASLSLFLKKKAPSEKAEPSKKSRISFHGLSPVILILLLGVFLMNVGQVNVSKYLDVLVIDLGYEASTLGHFVLVTGLVGFAANVFLVPLLKKAKIRNEMILIIAFLLLTAGCVAFEFNAKGDLLVFLYTIHMGYMLFKSMVTPLEQNYIARFSNEKTKGSIMGIRQMSVSAASVVGPLLGSAVYQKGSSLIMSIAAGFIAASCIVLIPLLFLKKKEEAKQETDQPSENE